MLSYHCVVFADTGFVHIHHHCLLISPNQQTVYTIYISQYSFMLANSSVNCKRPMMKRCSQAQLDRQTNQKNEKPSIRHRRWLPQHCSFVVLKFKHRFGKSFDFLWATLIIIRIKPNKKCLEPIHLNTSTTPLCFLCAHGLQ